VRVPWEKERHQWASAKAKLFILNAGAVEDALIMCAISVVRLVATVKPQPLGIMLGRERLFKE